MVSTIANVSQQVTDPFLNIYDRLVHFIPGLIFAAIILILGWVIGSILGSLVEKLFRITGLQRLFEIMKVEEILQKAEIHRDTSYLFGAFVKWVIILVAFIAAADKLRLPDVSDFLTKVLAYLPHVVGAAAILLIGFIFAQFMANVIKSSIKAGNLAFANWVAAVTRYSIIVFTILAALAQLGIATDLIRTLFTGFVAAAAIAAGLAYGLGGQEAAKNSLNHLKEEFNHKDEKKEEKEEK